LAFRDRLRGKLPGLLFLAGAGMVMASTFLPWRQATTPIIHEPYSIDYSQEVANALVSAELKLFDNIGPRPSLSAIGVIVMLIGSVIGFAKRRVAAVTRPAQSEPGPPLADAHGLAQPSQAAERRRVRRPARLPRPAALRAGGVLTGPSGGQGEREEPEVHAGSRPSPRV
jgi:hypothetical protein